MAVVVALIVCDIVFMNLFLIMWSLPTAVYTLQLLFLVFMVSMTIARACKIFHI